MPNPENGQTHSANSSDFADELVEFVWPFSGVGTYRVNGTFFARKNKKNQGKLFEKETDPLQSKQIKDKQLNTSATRTM